VVASAAPGYPNAGKLTTGGVGSIRVAFGVMANSLFQLLVKSFHSLLLASIFHFMILLTNLKLLANQLRNSTILTVMLSISKRALVSANKTVNRMLPSAFNYQLL
jgi:hypothetical protein